MGTLLYGALPQSRACRLEAAAGGEGIILHVVWIYCYKRVWAVGYYRGGEEDRGEEVRRRRRQPQRRPREKVVEGVADAAHAVADSVKGAAAVIDRHRFRGASKLPSGFGVRLAKRSYATRARIAI